MRSRTLISAVILTGALFSQSFAANEAAGKTPDLPNPLTLKAALEFALDNNFSIRQARERIREQDGLVIQARAQILPQAGVSANYSTYDDELSTPGASSSQNWGVSLTVQQVIYAGGGASAGVKSQKLVREAAIFELQSVINNSLTDVRTNFYNVLLARDQVTVQEQNVKLYEEQLQNVKSRHNAGTVSSFEVLRSEVVLANAKPALIRARNNYRIAIDVLMQSLGQTNTPGAIPEITGTLAFVPQTFELEQSLITAQEKRPELQQLKKMLDAGEANIRVQRAGYRPQLSVFGGYEYAKNTYSDSLRLREAVDGWIVGAKASWAIFDGRLTAGRVAQARSQLSQTQLSYDDLTLAINVEVRSALSSLQEAGELADAAKKVVDQAVEALRLANARYSAGNATQLDVLQAQVELTQARDNQLQANYSYNTALASVRKAIGVGVAYIDSEK